MPKNYNHKGIDVFELTESDAGLAIKEMENRGYKVRQVLPIIPGKLDTGAVSQEIFLQKEKSRILDMVSEGEAGGVAVALSPFCRKLQVNINSSTGFFNFPGYVITVLDKKPNGY